MNNENNNLNNQQNEYYQPNTNNNNIPNYEQNNNSIENQTITTDNNNVNTISIEVNNVQPIDIQTNVVETTEQPVLYDTTNQINDKPTETPTKRKKASLNLTPELKTAISLALILLVSIWFIPFIFDLFH